MAEALRREKRQAAVVVFREIHPGYLMPVGVWHSRESVREALRKKPMKFEKLEEALKYISTKLEIPLKSWVRNSNFLKSLLYQKKLLHYIKP